MGANTPRVPPTLGDTRCSFCGKPGDEVAAIVCGPSTDTAICDECVELCAEIVAEQSVSGPAPPPAAA